MIDPKVLTLVTGPIGSDRTSAAFNAARFVGSRFALWSGEMHPYRALQQLQLLGLPSGIVLTKEPWNTELLDETDPSYLIIDGAHMLTYPIDIGASGIRERLLRIKGWCQGHRCGALVTFQTSLVDGFKTTARTALDLEDSFADQVWRFISPMKLRCTKGTVEGKEWEVLPLLKLAQRPKAQS